MANGLFGVLSAHQSDKSWWFNTIQERDAKVAELSLNGFEVRHGIYVFDNAMGYWV